MPSFNIVKKVSPKETFRVASVMGKFDLQNNQVIEKFNGYLDLDFEWQVGLIVGGSGTGKTTIAKDLFPDSYVYEYEYSSETILDDMPKKTCVSEITSIFNQVGFSSVTSWLKPYDVLSNGEKMRVDLAKSLLMESNLIVFDEFTSVVDRKIAKIGSFAVQKAIRRTEKKFVACSG